MALDGRQNCFYYPAYGLTSLTSRLSTGMWVRKHGCRSHAELSRIRLDSLSYHLSPRPGLIIEVCIALLASFACIWRNYCLSFKCTRGSWAFTILRSSLHVLSRFD